MSRQPLHLAILERGVATLEAYLGLTTTLIVDLQRGLVTPKQASTLMLDAMPENMALPAAIVEEMCGVLLDSIDRGGEAPDAASARLLSVLLRQLEPCHVLVGRARAPTCCEPRPISGSTRCAAGGTRRPPSPSRRRSRPASTRRPPARCVMRGRCCCSVSRRRSGRPSS